MSLLEYSKKFARLKFSSKNGHRCNICPYFTSSAFLMRNHLRTHRSTKILFNCENADVETFRCNDCNFSTQLTLVFKQHLMKRHNRRKVKAKQPNVEMYICTNCNWETHYLLKWLQHSAGCSKAKEVPNPDEAHIPKHTDEEIATLLPVKTKQRYLEEHEKFVKWCDENNISKYTEEALLAFFKLKSEFLTPSTLWTMFSMLKSTLFLKNNIRISKFHRVTAFLKKRSVTYDPKKAAAFSESQVQRFLTTAPDEKFLLIKTALIIGLSASCRRLELTYLTIENVQFEEDRIVVTLPDAKPNTTRTSVINNKDWVNIVKKYYGLRPTNIEIKRFFLYYANNKCTRQPVGMNTFAKMPRKVAEFLRLPNSQAFTGSSFRKSSSKFLAKGTDLLK